MSKGTYEYTASAVQERMMRVRLECIAAQALSNEEIYQVAVQTLRDDTCKKNQLYDSSVRSTKSKDLFYRQVAFNATRFYFIAHNKGTRLGIFACDDLNTLVFSDGVLEKNRTIPTLYEVKLG